MASGSGSGSKPLLGVIEPFDPGPTVERAVPVLKASGTPFALIGGLALEAWGIQRATKDVDFAVPVGAAEPLAERLKGETGLARPLRIGGMGIRDDDGPVRIDLIDRRFYFGALYRAAIDEAVASGRKVQIGNEVVAVVSLEYLLAMKMVSGEPKDDADVRRLLSLESLEYQSARELVLTHLGAASASRLDAMAREAGRPEVTRRLYRNGDDMPEA